MTNFPFKRAIVAGTLLLGFAACIPPPPANIAPIVFTQDYSDSDNQHRVIPDNITPLSLNYCIQIGLQNNPDYLSKAASVSAAWARYYQSLASYMPGVTLTGSYNGNTSKQHTQPTSTMNASSLGANAEYLIFNGFAREMEMMMAQAKGRQSEHLNTDARRILIRAIGTTYNQILLYREEVCIQKQNVQCNLELIDQAEKQFEAGTATLADVLYWRIKYNDTQIALITARFKERITRFVLAALMGLTDAEIPSIPYSPEEQARMAAQDPKQPTSNYPDDATFPRIKDLHSYVLSDVNVYLDAALKNRPDLKAYRELLKAAEYQLISQYAGFMPTVKATAGTNFTSNIYSAESDQYGQGVNWGVNASWNIFEGFATWNRVREAQALLEVSRYDVANQWISVVSEVRQEHAYYQQYREQLAIAESRLRSATRSYELILDQYKVGTIEVVRVNESLRDRISAEIEVANYIIQVFNSQIRLEAAAAYNM